MFTFFSFERRLCAQLLPSGKAVLKKLKLSHYAARRGLGGEEVQFLLILDLGTYGGEWSASRPGRDLAPGKGPRYPLYRGLGGPQSRSGHRGYRKILSLCRGSNLDRPVVQSVARHYTD
jgi:hypothetical protein